MENLDIVVKGAREHNLKDISITIPRNKITVITGLSGSGKSSVAFDIVYAEGQRRYVESLSAYARNFMGQLKKPDVDAIHGLSPAIAIDQKTTITNPRSTVGTLTEVYDFLRLLYARIGRPKCPEHKVPVTSQQPQQIIDEVMSLKPKTKFYVVAPVVQDQKGEFLAEFQKWARKGFTRARVDGRWIDLEKAKKLAKHKRHNIDLLVDRLKVEEKFRGRLAESLNLSLGLSKGLVKIEEITSNGKEKSSKLYSIHQSCPLCGYSFPELDPRVFSFNNPRGACKTCEGLGYIEDEWEGEEDEGHSSFDRKLCPDCEGRRLNPAALSVVIDGKNISEFVQTPVDELQKKLRKLKLESRDKILAEKILEQIQSRLEYMVRVGTSYLSLDRPTQTLSGGEMQRVRLATQMGSSMVGVLYVLDEPSIGLHPRDHHRLLEILKEIQHQGNTILLVEHDEDTIRAADHVIDLGPRAGILGGEVIAEGTPKQLTQIKKSLTGQYLKGTLSIPVPKFRKKGHGEVLALKGARGNNLQSVNLQIPLGTLCGVTGVSGSGKSTLVVDTLYRLLAHKLYNSTKKPADYGSLQGLKYIDKVIEINQKPIGRTPRSVPSTYVDALPLIRSLYAGLPESKIRGYTPGHFSFNVKGGRCEPCQGNGQMRIEMHFLPDVFVECAHCRGSRYSSETMNIKFKDKSIADVLKMTVSEASEFFKHHRSVHAKLKTLERVGLGYISLGQSSTTLSGGEAQRIKLSKELSKRGTGKTLYILDEPTTGLHFEDIRKLIELLHELVDQGNTVLVIEHNLDVIKNCDHIIDLGPEGGRGGGKIIAEGTPEKVSKTKKSITGKFLAEVF